MRRFQVDQIARITGRVLLAAATVSGVVAGVGCMGEYDQVMQGETDGGCIGECDGTATEGSADFCVLDPEDKPDGDAFRHECDFDVEILVGFEIEPAFQTPNDFLYEGGVGSTLDYSTPERPAAAACCSHIEDDENYGGALAGTCATPHHKGCISGLISLVCHQPGKWLEADADRSFSGEGEIAVRMAAEWLHNHRQECYEHFWAVAPAIGDPEDETSFFEWQDFCDEDVVGGGNGVAEPFEPRHLNGTPVSWSDSLGLFTVQNMQITFGYQPNAVGTPTQYIAPVSPGEEPVECDDPSFNNSLVTLPYELTDGSFPIEPFDAEVPADVGTLVANVDVDADGPTWNGEAITGSGAFGTTGSRMLTDTTYYFGFQDMYVGEWRWIGSGTPSVGTTSTSYNLENWAMEAIGIAVADVVDPYGAEWSIPSGGAAFNLSAEIDGTGSSAVASNSTQIYIERINGSHPGCPGTGTDLCLKTHAFEIEYTDVFDDSWTLEVDAAYWAL